MPHLVSVEQHELNTYNFIQVSGVAVVESGVILQTLDEHLAGYGYTVPLDLGAKGR